MAVHPLVSVVVTFYNQAEFVASALESVLAQTYDPFEVLVVDDGSTDDTRQACAAYGDRVTVLHQANAGPSSARNAGLERARGSFVAFLDGDDTWAPEKLAVQVDLARRHPGSGLVAVDGVAFSGDRVCTDSLYGLALRGRLEDAADGVLVASCLDLLLESKYANISTPSQVMVPAEVFREIGPWNPRFRVSADYELYLRIAARRPFTFSSEKLVRYRLNPAGLSGSGIARIFNWVEEKPAIFRVMAGGDRRRAARLTSELARETARKIYHHGIGGQRPLANRLLVRYALRSRRPHFVLPYLAALWLPAWLRTRLASRR